MAHLNKLPTWFVRGDERRAAYYTVQVRELRKAGWVEEDERAEARKPIERLPEIVNEVGAEPFDSTESLTESLASGDDLDAMTKAELLDWALDHNVDLPSGDLKAEILAACRKIQAND